MSQLLWTPGAEQLNSSRLVQYQSWLATERGITTRDYGELWQWSIDNIEDFWRSIWDFFDIQSDCEREPVLTTMQMPGAQWFPNARLNFAEHVFRNANQKQPAVIARSEGIPSRRISWAELESSTAALAATLRDWGVVPGDRVASYMPNLPETLSAFLACASIGAVWSSCAPDMGASVVLDRFRQIEPKVIFATDSYSYNGTESYFDMFPGVWRHGDWIRFTDYNSAVIYGRSDSTINRFGIRMGTSEIYRVVEELPEVRDSLVVDLEYLGRPSLMVLFVLLQQGRVIDDAIRERISLQIRTKASARHVPDEVVQVVDIPRTLSGKKMEVPVRKLLLGSDPDKVASADAMQNPESLAFYIEYARSLQS